MPHVIVKLYPGRNNATLKKLANKIVEDVASIAGCEKKVVSIAMEEIDPSDWPEKVYRPDILDNADSLIVKPGYNPFDT